MSATLTAQPRELDSRENNGITVRLLWDPRTDATYVSVFDDPAGRIFKVGVPAGVNPLDVFNHPYAYHR